MDILLGWVFIIGLIIYVSVKVHDQDKKRAQWGEHLRLVAENHELKESLEEKDKVISLLGGNKR